MASLRHLKTQARREEQRGNWSRAVELYRRALEESESSHRGFPDLGLYNRIGDLYLRHNEPSRAIEYYLQAVDRYADQELYGGAIALCNKVLRIDGDRVEVYRRLGRLHAASGLVAEARANFLAYASRLEEQGDEAGPLEAFLELARLTEDGELYLEVVDRLLSRGERDRAVAELLHLYSSAPRFASVADAVRERLLSLAPDALSPTGEQEPKEPPRPGAFETPSGPEDVLAAAEADGDLEGALGAEAPAAPSGTPPSEVAGGPDAGDAESGSDDRDLDHMLVGFRAREDARREESDPEARCEFGIALRDMGRIEDAIREFQAAARSPEPPLRAFELLGGCFADQGMHTVAVRVLTRALRVPGHREADLLGILYQLGVARQELGQTEQALECFERVYSVDIDFRDVGERMRACAL